MNIIDLAEELGLELQVEQPPEYGYLCPVHNDTNASLWINAEKNVWHCWACDAGGGPRSLIKFVGGDEAQISLGQPILPVLRMDKDTERKAMDAFVAICEVVALDPSINVWPFSPEDIAELDRLVFSGTDIDVLIKCRRLLAKDRKVELRNE